MGYPPDGDEVQSLFRSLRHAPAAESDALLLLSGFKMTILTKKVSLLA